MADDLSSPPIRSQVIDSSGRMTQPWASWFSGLYRRIGQALGRPTTAIDADVAALAEGSSSVETRLTAVEEDVLAQDSRIDTLESGPVAPSFMVATAPAAVGHTGRQILVTNEVGGPVLAFSDGTNWRRVTDRAVIA